MSYIQDYMNKKFVFTSMLSYMNKARNKNSNISTGFKVPRNMCTSQSTNFSDSCVINDFDIPIWFHMHILRECKVDDICYNEIQSYLIKALNYYKDEIIDRVIANIEEDKRNALFNCEQEAKGILEQINAMRTENNK